MKPRNLFGVQARLLLLVGVSVLPFLFFTLYSAAQRRADELENVHDNAMALARQVAAEQSQILGHTRQWMLGVALSHDSAGDPLLRSDCERRMRILLQSYPLYSQVSIADPRGNVVCTGKPLPVPVNIADRDYFRLAVETRGFALSNAIVGRATGRRTIVAAQALVDGKQKILGVLLAALDLDWVQRLLSRVKLPSGAVVSLIDAEGTIYARFPDPESFTGRTIPDVEGFKRKTASVSEGYAEVRGLDGIERIVAYAQLTSWPGAREYVRI